VIAQPAVVNVLEPTQKVGFDFDETLIIEIDGQQYS
jgi:hypothetical protein